MTESQKLSVLRGTLIHRRRYLVERIQVILTNRLDGDDLARVQKQIEAVERAMAEFRLRPFAGADTSNWPADVPR
jgi:hypothetical protein